MLGGADNSNGELQSYIIGANKSLLFIRLWCFLSWFRRIPEDPFCEVMPFYLLPVNTADKPAELIWCQAPGDIICPGPAKMAFVQSANAQPDAMFIPAQHFDARAAFVGKDERGTFVPR